MPFKIKIATLNKSVVKKSFARHEVDGQAKKKKEKKTKAGGEGSGGGSGGNSVGAGGHIIWYTAKPSNLPSNLF